MVSADNAQTVARALKSPHLSSIFNRAFGKRNERLKDKSLSDVLGLLNPFVSPLPTMEELAKIYQTLPAVMIYERRHGVGVDAGLVNFRVSQDGKVNFDIIMYNEQFDLETRDLDACLHLMLRTALSVYFSKYDPDGDVKPAYVS